MTTLLKIFFLVTTLAFLIAEGLIQKLNSPLKPIKNTYKIVLLGNGSDVRNPVLRDRLERTLEAAKLYPSAKILITGDRSQNEISPLKEYLIEEGLAPGRIEIDSQSKSTWQSAMNNMNMTRSAEDTVIVITNDFHLARAVASFRAAGVSAQGFGRDSSTYPKWLWYFTRERLSRVKWLVQYVHLKSKPQPRD